MSEQLDPSAVQLQDAAPPYVVDWGQAYVKYRPELLRSFTRLMQNPAAAEDIVQETFIGAMNGNFEHGTNLRAFLYRVGINKANDTFRKRNRSPIEAPLYDDMGTIPAYVEVSAGAAMDIAELVVPQQFVMGILSKLSGVRREMLQARLDGYSYEEIAERLGVQVGTVSSGINRARKELRAAIREQEDHEAA